MHFSNLKILSFNIDDVVTDFQQGWWLDLLELGAHSERWIFSCVWHPAASLLGVRPLDMFVPMCAAHLKSCLPAAPLSIH